MVITMILLTKGFGYRMVLQTMKGCDVNEVLKAILKYIPDAKV